jgi:hypothetical protein
MTSGCYKFVRTKDVRKQETVKGVYNSRVERKERKTPTEAKTE